MAQKGLFFHPTPLLKSIQHWGNIACNAGGMRCVKYGVTRDYVLGLEGYLANGEFVQWGLPLKKYVSGFNLRDLWIGSEGCLEWSQRRILNYYRCLRSVGWGCLPLKMKG